MTHPCMPGPADAVVLLPSHTKATQDEFEAAMMVQKLLQASHPSAEGGERLPSTDAAESREGAPAAQATARAAEGEGEAGRGEGGAAEGATKRAREAQESAAEWLRIRKEAGRVPEAGQQSVVARYVDADEAAAGRYPGVPANGPARIRKGVAR